MDKLERSCRSFAASTAKAGKKSATAPKKGEEAMTADEYFNVIKMQHGIDIGKDEARKITGYFDTENAA